MDQNLTKLYRCVILTPGNIVSFSLLNRKSFFKKTVAGVSGRALMDKILKMAKQTQLGTVETYEVPGNKSKVSILYNPNSIIILHSNVQTLPVQKRTSYFS